MTKWEICIKWELLLSELWCLKEKYLCNSLSWKVNWFLFSFFPPRNIQFSSVQPLSRVRLFATPWIAALQASLSITNSQSLLKLMSIESLKEWLTDKYDFQSLSVLFLGKWTRGTYHFKKSNWRVFVTKNIIEDFKQKLGFLKTCVCYSELNKTSELSDEISGDINVWLFACNAGDLGSIPGSGRSPGEGNGNPL